MKLKPKRVIHGSIYIPVVALWSITRTFSRWAEELSDWLESKHKKMSVWIDEKTDYLEKKYGGES